MVDVDRLAEARRIATRRGSGALDALRREILGEISASLGRAEERILKSLAALRALGIELDAEPGSGEPVRPRSVILQDYARERASLQRFRWELEVQREALGLRHHAVLEEKYPIPPPRQ